MDKAIFFARLCHNELTLFFFRSRSFFFNSIFAISFLALLRFLVGHNKLALSHSIAFLWATHFLISVFILFLAQTIEKENKIYQLLRLYNIPSSFLFLAKAISTLISIYLVWIITLGVWILFFEPKLLLDFTTYKSYCYNLLLLSLLVSTIMALLGTLLSYITIFLENSVVLLSILYFPMILPSLLLAAQISPLSGADQNWQIWTLLYSVVLITLGIGLLFIELVLED